MKKFTYVCDNCEDTEEWKELLKPGFHCECGGHLHLVKRDNFKKVKDYTDCLICKRKGSSKCIDCSHDGAVKRLMKYKDKWAEESRRLYT